MSPKQLAQTLRRVADILEDPNVRVEIKRGTTSSHIPQTLIERVVVQTGPEEVTLDFLLKIYK